jgi:formylglycine-generating enzyme required for sulfatase activity
MDDGAHFVDQTTVVGIYPDGESPAGALGMAGNVWEWCAFQYRLPDDNGPGGQDGRVSRSGSWYSVSAGCRCASRRRSHSGDRLNVIGIRVLLAPPIL